VPKYLAGTLMLVFTSLLYSFTNRCHGPARELPLTLLDRGPLLPWTAWVYVSYPLLFLVVFVLEDDLERLGRYLRGTFVLNVASNAFFLAYPTTFARSPVPPGGASASLLECVRSLDAAANCLPSLHVSTSYLAAFLAARRSARRGVIAFAWATAIAVSTVTTKQHYAVDGLAGLGLAALIDAVFVGEGSRGPIASKRGHLGCVPDPRPPYSFGPVRIGRDSRAFARPDTPREASPGRGGSAPRRRRAG
jgi:membrane-associated phospholipid phosphatase